jgi:hypothetical protein
MRDLASNLGVTQAVTPAVLAATTKGAAIDLLGFNSALIAITTGAIVGAGNFTAKLQESDTTTDGDFADVDASDLIGALPASLAANATVKQGYVGSKRYVRAVLTLNSGTSIAAGAVAVLGDASSRPVA